MTMNVPFFRPQIGQAEIDEVMDTLKSGWLTTGPKVRQFESDFAAFVGAKHAIALNSCTAALHLALEALEVKAGDVVLVPTMTFAASAEVVRYLGAIPLLVDCDPATFNVDLADADRKISAMRAGRFAAIKADAPIVGIIPVNVAGLMVDIPAVKAFAARHGLWIVEDAAHSLPASYRENEKSEWVRCGDETADVTCFSFYANKTITTGEGGMATTSSDALAERMRIMSLHGLSLDAWARYSGGKSWDYKIIAPGFKYNLTDIGGALGIHQLKRAEEMRVGREEVALRYCDVMGDIEELELPVRDRNRIHSWHLFPIRLNLDKLDIDRNEFLDQLKSRGVGCSVHWRPLHLHPYYQETFGWKDDDCAVATATWQRVISLPIFSGMRDEEIEHVTGVVRELAKEHARTTAGVSS
ncbi:MAG TPA: aminotransferase class I/II-fold pyridoxal phosphate-dependent enzyme [Thermoanaerobaculia bacterium]|nr:aminotransferase class I/II-fold pyridoxal phosphate-dependent enzyme [Thermoanaerobaculia bacterium]